MLMWNNDSNSKSELFGNSTDTKTEVELSILYQASASFAMPCFSFNVLTVLLVGRSFPDIFICCTSKGMYNCQRICLSQVNHF